MTKIVRKKSRTFRKIRIVLRAKDAHTKQDLGNGFFRRVFPVIDIQPNTVTTLLLVAGTGRVAVNGGWFVEALATAYASNSYPVTDTQWVLVIHNPTDLIRTIRPYLITKRR